MRLLICTQKVDRDDPILGFFHRWLIEFARHFDSVIVICLEERRHELPANVRVLSLGKEAGVSRMGYMRRFYSYIWHERRNYDRVFVHMNQIYVILGGLFWKLWNKKIGLWYAHRAVSLRLRVAACLADEIFTTAPESFGLQTEKLHVVGHGIDVESFMGEAHHAHSGRAPRAYTLAELPVGSVLHGHDVPPSDYHSSPRLISVGRITRIKNLETLIEAIGLLRDDHPDIECVIIGPRVTPDDDSYFDELRSAVKSRGLQEMIHFKDAVPQSEIGAYYRDNDFNVNLTPTGGVDKVVLEGMAAGCVPLVSKEAFRPIFGAYADKLTFRFQDPTDLAAKIQALWRTDRTAISAYLKDKVRADFDVKTAVGKISSVMLG